MSPVKRLGQVCSVLLSSLKLTQNAVVKGKLREVPSEQKLFDFIQTTYFLKKNPSIGMNSVLCSTVEERS